VLKPRSTNDHNSRESYLRAATNELRPYFAKHGLILPEKIRFDVAFTSHGTKGKVAGECWHAGASDDGHHEIIIRTDFDAREEVLGILAHELVHAALPPDAKHGKVFREAALKIGLEEPMRHAMPGAVLKERLNKVASSLGPFPHARLNFDRVTLTGEVAADRQKKAGNAHAQGRMPRPWLRLHGAHCRAVDQRLRAAPLSEAWRDARAAAGAGKRRG
jgi:SprT-like family